MFACYAVQPPVRLPAACLALSRCERKSSWRGAEQIFQIVVMVPTTPWRWSLRTGNEHSKDPTGGQHDNKLQLVHVDDAWCRPKK